MFLVHCCYLSTTFSSPGVPPLFMLTPSLNCSGHDSSLSQSTSNHQKILVILPEKKKSIIYRLPTVPLLTLSQAIIISFLVCHRRLPSSTLLPLSLVKYVRRGTPLLGTHQCPPITLKITKICALVYKSLDDWPVAASLTYSLSFSSLSAASSHSYFLNDP